MFNKPQKINQEEAILNKEFYKLSVEQLKNIMLNVAKEGCFNTEQQENNR